MDESPTKRIVQFNVAYATLGCPDFFRALAEREQGDAASLITFCGMLLLIHTTSVTVGIGTLCFSSGSGSNWFCGIIRLF